MSYPQLWLKRLRVLKGGLPVYDQNFHLGINIIHGENGSGKSTIADFIFYVLGGEFDKWKKAAAACDQVQAEVVTQGGILVLRRDIGKARTPIHVFFGQMADAELQALERWELYPIRRVDSHLSFSQMLFRSAGIPEAQSQGASNITMHQILRLLYSDQRTPAGFLFKYEAFDTREIREAVGDLICGLSVYELYEVELSLRALDSEFNDKAKRLSALLTGMPREFMLTRVDAIDERLEDLSSDYQQQRTEIQNVEKIIPVRQVQEFVTARSNAVEKIRRIRDQIKDSEQKLHVSELESADLTSFLDYLTDLSRKLPRAQASSEIIGNIDFVRCPACLAPLAGDKGVRHCVLCGTETDADQERSRYLQIKTDLDMQIRESRQLLQDKQRATYEAGRDLRRLKQDFQEKLSDFAVTYDVSTSPRESFLGRKYRRIGQIDRERSELEQLRERVSEIEKLSDEKAVLRDE